MDEVQNSEPYEPTPPHNQALEQGPSWYLDDNTPGEGERPAWLPGKYKSAADLGKSYVELEKKLGAFTGAPEKYNFDEIGLDESQLMVGEITSVAKELNMSQEGLNKLLGRIMHATETEDAAHLEEQVKTLGQDGERMMNEFKNWTRDYFRPEQAEVIKGWIKNADDLKTFNHIMAHNTKSAVPTSGDFARMNHHETVATLRSELTENIQKYDSDSNYRKNWTSRLAAAIEREKG